MNNQDEFKAMMLYYNVLWASLECSWGWGHDSERPMHMQLTLQLLVKSNKLVFGIKVILTTKMTPTKVFISIA
jgi:hypothetical protein